MAVHLLTACGLSDCKNWAGRYPINSSFGVSRSWILGGLSRGSHNACRAKKNGRFAVACKMVLKGYGVPKTYPGPQEPSAPEQCGDGRVEKKDFWNYGAPSDYGAPSNYRSPKGYRAPSAYGPGALATVAVEVDVVEDVKSALEEGVNEDSSALEEVKAEVGGGDGGAGIGGGGHGRGGGGGGGGGRGGSGEEEASKKMSASQKFTLIYAGLISLGGIIGFYKTGSTKSLLASAVSALLLVYVYALLPRNPADASLVGIGVSATLLFLMAKRFKKSGRVFPAGIISALSLIMTGGYIHGLKRSWDDPRV